MNRDGILSLFSYRPEQGILFWTVTGSPSHAGEEAGYKKPEGRVYITIGRRGIYRSHLVWCIETGELPPAGFMLDHKDRNPANDKFSNLRIATRSDNWVNTRMWKVPKSNHRCIQITDHGKFSVRVTKKGFKAVKKNFDSLDDAIACRNAAWEIMHGEFIGEMQRE